MVKSVFCSEALERRYEILSLLGRGGMADVYLARDTELNRQVAIKFRTVGDEQDPDLQAESRFEEEGRVMDLLKHPGIVRLYSAGKDGHRDFLIFEYVEGETLADVLRREKRLPVARTVTILLEVLRALQHAHAAGIVHRDLKPDNVMIRTPVGTAHIMDFGVARRDSGRSFETRPGVIIGTPTYMPREQIRDRAITPGTDIYAAGVIAYECLSGTPPFCAPTDSELFRLLLSDLSAPDLHQIIPDFPGELSRILARSLEKDPAKRYTDAGEMRQELESFASKSGFDLGASREFVPPPGTAPASASGSVRPPPPASSVKRQRSGPPSSRSALSAPRSAALPAPDRRRLAAAGGAVLLLLGALAAFSLVRRSSVTRQVSAAGKVEVSTTAPTAFTVSLIEPRLTGARLIVAGATPGEQPVETPFGDRRSLEVPLGLLDEERSLHILGEDAEGPVVIYDLPRVRGLVPRLLEDIEQVDPPSIFKELVKDRSFVSMESYEDHRNAAAPGTHFTKALEKILRPHPLLADLEHFRAVAPRYFEDPAIETSLKRRMVDRLTKLHLLDVCLIFQRNLPLMKIPQIHAPFIRVEHDVAPGPIDPATPHVIRSPTSWKTEDHDQVLEIEIFNDMAPVTSRVLEEPYPPPPGTPAPRVRRPAPRDYLPLRSFPLELAGKPGATRIRVRTRVAFVGPAYFYEARFLDTKGVEALRLFLGHSGELDWYRAMDGALGAPLEVVDGVPQPNLIRDDLSQLCWGEIRHEFAANLLPPGSYTVRISYQHLPGPSIRHWGKHQRLAFIQRMALEYLEP